MSDSLDLRMRRQNGRRVVVHVGVDGRGRRERDDDEGIGRAAPAGVSHPQHDHQQRQNVEVHIVGQPPARQQTLSPMIAQRQEIRE